MVDWRGLSSYKFHIFSYLPFYIIDGKKDDQEDQWDGWTVNVHLPRSKVENKWAAYPINIGQEGEEKEEKELNK